MNELHVGRRQFAEHRSRHTRFQGRLEDKFLREVVVTRPVRLGELTAQLEGLRRQAFDPGALPLGERRSLVGNPSKLCGQD